ncbi:Alpha/Beta hydrolase protein [Hyaloraphidium curvatum]|nr:Alpha/Beta hydrolase protein [Hyaloraphidium curvatum]
MPTPTFVHALPAGGALQYSSAGVPASEKTVIFWPGLFGVASAETRFEPLLKTRGIHWIAITPPGQGGSKFPPGAGPLATWLPAAVADLLRALGKKPETLRLLVAGGSYGTVHAQVVYGAPASAFEFAGCLVGALLMAPFSPFALHADYSRDMGWGTYLAVGRPSLYLPVLRIASWITSSKLSTEEGALAFMKDTLFDTMDAAERERFAEWRARYGVAEGELERGMARGAAEAVAGGWECFLGCATEINADWGFVLRELKGRGKVLVVMGKGDDRAPNGMGEWLVREYPDAEVVHVHGGHLSGLFEMEEVVVRALDAAGM